MVELHAFIGNDETEIKEHRFNDLYNANNKPPQDIGLTKVMEED